MQIAVGSPVPRSLPSLQPRRVGSGEKPLGLMPTAGHPWTYLAQDDSKGKHIHLLIIASAWTKKLTISR